MNPSHGSHLYNGRYPFPILESTPNLDLEHPEHVDERAAPVSDHAADRTVIRQEFRDPLLGPNYFLSDLPPFVLQIVINDERSVLHLHEGGKSNLPD